MLDCRYVGLPLCWSAVTSVCHSSVCCYVSLSLCLLKDKSHGGRGKERQYELFRIVDHDCQTCESINFYFNFQISAVNRVKGKVAAICKGACGKYCAGCRCCTSQKEVDDGGTADLEMGEVANVEVRKQKEGRKFQLNPL